MIHQMEKIVISGTPFERGVSYGKQASAKIAGSLDNYRILFDRSKAHISFR